MHVAVCIDDAGLLSQSSLSIDGGHAKESNDPHPEDSTGAAGEDCAGCTNDVAGTDLSCNGGSQSLEGAHAALVLVTAELYITENLLHAFAEAANLNKAGFD